MIAYHPTFVRVDNAQTGTTTAPSAATDGIAHPGRRHRKRVHLEIRKAAASGTRTCQVKVFGYRSRFYVDSSGDLTETETGAWFEIFDTGALSDSADFNFAYYLAGAEDFERYDTQVVTNGGTTPTLSTYIAFGGGESNKGS